MVLFYRGSVDLMTERYTSTYFLIVEYFSEANAGFIFLLGVSFTLLLALEVTIYF